MTSLICWSFGLYSSRIYPETRAGAASQPVRIFRPSMPRELEQASCRDSALLVTSLWSGTVKTAMDCIRSKIAAGIAYDRVHTPRRAIDDELVDADSDDPAGPSRAVNSLFAISNGRVLGRLVENSRSVFFNWSIDMPVRFAISLHIAL